MSDLKDLAVHLSMYAGEHEGRLPDSLDEFEPHQLSPNVLESPRKPADFDGPSYIYIPGHSANTPRAGKYIVVYENPAFLSDEIAVLFLDYHVETMGREAFREALKETYEYLDQPVPDIEFGGER